MLFRIAAITFANLRCRWGDDLFAIDTNHLLMQGDDARFDCRAKALILDRAGRVDVLLRQKFPELSAAAIFAEHSDYRNVIDKFAQIASNVGRASGIEGFARHLHDWDRCLRRDAADFSPDKFVQHQIADDGDLSRRRAVENLPQAVQIHGDLMLVDFRPQIVCGLRFEPFNEFGAAMSCERSQFRLKFAPINPKYEAEINSRNCQ